MTKHHLPTVLVVIFATTAVWCHPQGSVKPEDAPSSPSSLVTGTDQPEEPESDTSSPSSLDTSSENPEQYGAVDYDYGQPDPGHSYYDYYGYDGGFGASDIYAPGYPGGYGPGYVYGTGYPGGYGPGDVYGTGYPGGYGPGDVYGTGYPGGYGPVDVYGTGYPGGYGYGPLYYYPPYGYSGANGCSRGIGLGYGSGYVPFGYRGPYDQYAATGFAGGIGLGDTEYDSASTSNNTIDYAAYDEHLGADDQQQDSNDDEVATTEHEGLTRVKRERLPTSPEKRFYAARDQQRLHDIRTTRDMPTGARRRLNFENIAPPQRAPQPQQRAMNNNNRMGNIMRDRQTHGRA